MRMCVWSCSINLTNFKSVKKMKLKRMKLKSPEEMEAFVLEKALGAVILDGDVLKPLKKK